MISSREVAVNLIGSGELIRKMTLTMKNPWRNAWKLLKKEIHL
jgi:hypothetical protein